MKFPGIYINTSNENVQIASFKKVSGPSIITFESDGHNIIISPKSKYECNLCFTAPPLPGQFEIEVGTFDRKGNQVCANITL